MNLILNVLSTEMLEDDLHKMGLSADSISQATGNGR